MLNVPQITLLVGASPANQAAPGADHYFIGVWFLNFSQRIRTRFLQE